MKHFLLVLIATTIVFFPYYNRNVAAVSNLSDIEGHWAKEYILTLVDSSLLTGYPDGTFGANQSITRAEVATILSRDFNLTGTKETSIFSDSSKHWAAGSINAIAETGFIKGYSDGSFRPDQNITRAEAATLIQRSYDFSGDGFSVSFDDLPTTHWAYEQINSLVSNEVVNGYSDKRFGPDRNITRAEFAAILVRAKGSVAEESNQEQTNEQDEHELEPDQETEPDSSEEIAEESDQEQTDEQELDKLDTYLELNTPYVSSDNRMTVTMANIKVTEYDGYNEYTLSYTEENKTTDTVIDQGSFKIYYEDGSSEPQYGFFNELYPGQSSDRTYTFTALKGKEPLLVEYGADLFFNNSPSKETLKWEVSSTSEATEQDDATQTETNTSGDVSVSTETVKTIDDVTIEISKVEQDADSLRVHVKYTNNSTEAAMTGDSLAKIVSNGKQYSYDHDFNFPRYYETGVPKADHFIEPSVTEESVIFFEPIPNADTINIVLNSNFEDYRFNNIPVEEQ